MTGMPGTTYRAGSGVVTANPVAPGSGVTEERADATGAPGMPRQYGRSVVFKAACPDCGECFELAAAALRLAIGGSRRTTFYSFTCPECGAAVRKPAGERIIELLTGGGVRTLRLHSTP